MNSDDVGCHVAAMCAQAIEKSIKGYVLLNGATPALDHRPDKYIASLATKNDPLLRYRSHHSYLSKLFDTKTKRAVNELFDRTPGGVGNRDDVANTEYPWKEQGDWRHAPAGSKEFDAKAVREWLAVTKRVCDMLQKLWIMAEREVDA